jgi:hypothetical protein
MASNIYIERDDLVDPSEKIYASVWFTRILRNTLLENQLTKLIRDHVHQLTNKMRSYNENTVYFHTSR